MTTLRSRGHYIAALAVLAAPMVAPMTGHAEAPVDGSSEQTTTTVIVKGDRPAPKPVSKLSADPKDVPQSVSVLDKSLLQSEGATSLADALRNVPGITLGGAEGGQIGNNINLNGFTARTDIYLDGFRDRGQYYRDTFALEQVEVLMGPSSMLFGRGSTGGAINQVTHKPTLRAETGGALSVTGNGLVRATADVDQPLSPTSALRIDLMEQDGAPTTRKDMTVKDEGIAPSLKFGINTPTEITVSALVQHNNDRPDYGVQPLNGKPVVPDPSHDVYGYSSDRTLQDVTALNAGIKHKWSDNLSFRDQIQYNGVKTDAIETAPQTLGTIGSTGFKAFTVADTSSLPLDAIGVRLQSHDRVIHDTSVFDQAELNYSFDTGGVHHATLWGAEIGRDTYQNQAYYRNGTCNGAALNPVGGTSGYVACESLTLPTYGASPANVPESVGNLSRASGDTTGIYVNDTASFGSAFKLVAGLRWDRFAAAISNSINSANTPGNTTFPSLSQTVSFTSVRLGGIWQPTALQSYYVSYSTSFDPSLEQLTSTTGISRPLPPETNTAYELGGKWETPGDRLSLTAAAFQITQDNSRSQNSDNTYTADGTVRVSGLRLGASGKITDKWQVFGGYTHMDPKIIAAIALGTLGMVPTNTPKDSASLWTTYDLAPQWQVGGGAVHMSKRFDNNTDLVSVPGYVRWDATVAWRQPKYDLRLNLFNLFNVHYYDALIQSDGGRSVPGTGRTAMLSLNWHM